MSSFLTQCPHCVTSFRVTDTQQEAAGGMVRCGACLGVFSAPSNRIMVKQATPPEQPEDGPADDTHADAEEDSNLAPPQVEPASPDLPILEISYAITIAYGEVALPLSNAPAAEIQLPMVTVIAPQSVDARSDQVADREAAPLLTADQEYQEDEHGGAALWLDDGMGIDIPLGNLDLDDGDDFRADDAEFEVDEQFTDHAELIRHDEPVESHEEYDDEDEEEDNQDGEEYEDDGDDGEFDEEDDDEDEEFDEDDEDDDEDDDEEDDEDEDDQDDEDEDDEDELDADDDFEDEDFDEPSEDSDRENFIAPGKAAETAGAQTRFARAPRLQHGNDDEEFTAPYAMERFSAGDRTHHEASDHDDDHDDRGATDAFDDDEDSSPSAQRPTPSRWQYAQTAPRNNDKAAMQDYLADLEDEDGLEPLPMLALNAIDAEPVTFTARQVVRRRLLNVSLFCLNLVLAGTLILQSISINLDSLSRSARFAPLLPLVCRILECPIPERSDLASLHSQELLVRAHPRYASALEVNFIFRNDALAPQPFPALELSFSDRGKQLLTNRLFQPAEYLPPELLNLQEMPAQSSIQIMLELVDPGSEAVNYTLAFREP